MDKNILVFMVILSVFMVVIAASLPFLVGDSGRARMKAIRAKREAMRKDYTEKTTKVTSLRERLNKQTISGRISEKLNLKRFFDMERLRNKLMVAGWRDPSTLSKFLVIHLVLPFIVGGYIGWALYYGPLKSYLSPPMRPIAVIGAAALGLCLPSVMLANAAQNRALKLSKQFPDALDLMLVCVEAGLSVDAAMLRVAEQMGDSIPDVGEELALTGAELALLGDRPLSYKNLVSRTSSIDDFKQLATAMAQSDQYGSSMSSALKNMADQSRKLRTLEIEKKAASLGPKMTVPMVLFILPCMFLIIIGPTIVNIMGAPKIAHDN